MTENMRSVILRHKEALLTEEVKRRYNIDERRVLSAATLPELDEVYTRWGLYTVIFSRITNLHS